MSFRVDGGDKKKSTENVTGKHEFNKKVFERYRIQKQLEKIKKHLKKLAEKSDQQVAIKGFHFEYTGKSEPDSEELYRTLEIQQAELLKKLAMLDLKLNEQIALEEAELQIEKAKQE